MDFFRISKKLWFFGWWWNFGWLGNWWSLRFFLIGFLRLGFEVFGIVGLYLEGYFEYFFVELGEIIVGIEFLVS